MKAQSEFTIPYLGLTKGIHQYQFVLDNSFFKNFETSKIQEGEFEIEVLFDKQDRVVVVEMQCQGYFVTSCDRCLSEIQIPMDLSDRIVIKMTEKIEDNQSPEIYFMDPSTSHIDLSPFIYEAIHLNLPIKNVRDCASDEYKYCDLEVLKNLERRLLNKNVPNEGDPWKELRKLNLE